jgi:hypothetical protein
MLDYIQQIRMENGILVSQTLYADTNFFCNYIIVRKIDTFSLCKNIEENNPTIRNKNLFLEDDGTFECARRWLVPNNTKEWMINYFQAVWQNYTQSCDQKGWL